MPNSEVPSFPGIGQSVLEEELAALRDRAIRVAVGYGLPLEEAEDIAQEALLKFFVVSDRIQFPKAWISQVARNSARRRVRLWIGEASHSSRDVAVNPWPAAELTIEFRQLLARLTQPQARVALLHAFGATHRQIAHLEGISEKAVERRLARVRAAAKRLRADYC